MGPRTYFLYLGIWLNLFFNVLGKILPDVRMQCQHFAVLCNGRNLIIARVSTIVPRALQRRDSSYTVAVETPTTMPHLPQ